MTYCLWHFIIKISFIKGKMYAVFQKWWEPNPFWRLSFPGICGYFGSDCQSQIKLQNDVRLGLVTLVYSLSEDTAFSKAGLILRRETHYSSCIHLSWCVQPCSLGIEMAKAKTSSCLSLGSARHQKLTQLIKIYSTKYEPTYYLFWD